MSGAIRDVEKISQRQIETVKRRNEREIKKMEDLHQDYKADIQKAHSNEIVDLQHQNHSHIDKESQKKEKVLEEMKTHLQVTKDLTEKELKSLKNNSEKEKLENHKRLSADRERINSENQLYLDELNDRFNQSSRQITSDGRNRLEEMKTNMQGEYLETQQFQDKKIQDQTAEFTTRFTNDSKNYKQMKDSQDTQFKKERLSTNVRQQTELSKMSKVHVDHIEQKDGEYRKGLKEQELFFEKKYEGQLGRHSQEFKTLEEKNKKVVDSLKQSLANEIKKTADRNDDPFFKFETLKPQLKQYEDRVEVTVEVPDHSKQDLQLTTNGKEAVLSFNRRFADANRETDGTVNKINKIESFMTRIKTDHFLDAKSIKSTYDNGAMTYVIKKA